MGGLLGGLVIGLAFLKYENYPKIRWTIRLVLLGIGLALISKESSTLGGLIAGLIFFPLVFGVIGVVIDLVKNKSSENENPTPFDVSQYKQEASSSGIKQEINLSNSESSTNQNNSKRKVASDEDIWAFALEEFESKARIKGLYAKLYTQNDGNEQRIKSQYIKERFEQLKKEHYENQSREEAQLRARQEHLQKKELEIQKLKDSFESEVNGKFTSKRIVNGIECFIFEDEQVAIKVNERKFRLYIDFESAEKTINYFDTGAKNYEDEKMRYLDVGFIDWIVFKNDKKIISCPRCRQETRVPADKELEIVCPACKFQWREKT